MRLLVVTPFYKPAFVYGGPARSIPSLCEGFAQLQTEVTVFTTNANGKQSLAVEPRKEIDVDGVKVHYFLRDLPGSYFISSQLARACYRQTSYFDLVYVVSTWGFPFMPACDAARRANVPYVVSPRTAFMHDTWKSMFLKKGLYHCLFERMPLRSAAALHYTTELELQESKWLKLRPHPFIVPNPVTLDEFDQLPVKGLFRHKRGISTDCRLILFLGRIEQRKGLDKAVRAFSQVVDVFPFARLVIAGPEEDKYQGELQAISQQLGVHEQVIFTGYLNANERLEALADADLSILTSYSENFGMAIVEAMACSLPVVVSDRVGIADMIDKEQAGIVTPLDPGAIATALLRLMSDPELARSMGASGSRAVRQRYTPSAVAQHMLSEFDCILSARQRG